MWKGNMYLKEGDSYFCLWEATDLGILVFVQFIFSWAIHVVCILLCVSCILEIMSVTKHSTCKRWSLLFCLLMCMFNLCIPLNCNSNSTTTISSTSTTTITTTSTPQSPAPPQSPPPAPAPAPLLGTSIILKGKARMAINPYLHSHKYSPLLMIWISTGFLFGLMNPLPARHDGACL